MKRTPLRRKPLREGPSASKSEHPRARQEQKKCEAPKCGKDFVPARMGQKVCGSVCARRLLEAKRVEEAASARKRLKELDPQRKRKAKKKAQDAFNAFIRERDRDQPCISCLTTNPPELPGGQWDAGHFLSRGAYPELALNEDNCHKQCKSCNAGGGKFSHKERTVNEKYEANLIARIGSERVAALRRPHPALHLTADDYEEIAATYRAKKRELEKRIERETA